MKTIKNKHRNNWVWYIIHTNKIIYAYETDSLTNIEYFPNFGKKTAIVCYLPNVCYSFNCSYLEVTQRQIHAIYLKFRIVNCNW